MAKRTDLSSILILVLALQIGAATSALAAEKSSESVGGFRHGLWEGRCFRDGFLSGRSQETCTAWSHGAVRLELDRTAEQLAINAAIPGCEASVDGESIKATSLVPMAKIGPKAVAQIVRSMANTVLVRAGMACKIAYSAAALDARDLEAVVNETNDLRPLN